MNETDCRNAFDEISRELRGVQLGALVDRVERAASEGQIETVESQSYRYGRRDEGTGFDLVPAREAQFEGVRPYSDCERLELLLKAVQHVVVDQAEMVQETLGTLAEYGVDRVEFVDNRFGDPLAELEEGPDALDLPSREVTLEEAQGGALTAAEIRELLEQLRSGI